MPVYKTDDLEIQFPFEPYDIQKDLMTKVVECCRLRQNGLLESPTGTGKTLSLLCAAIAWQRKQKFFAANDLANSIANGSLARSEFGMGGLNPNIKAAFSTPKIIYSSRTHSQLSQAVQELKRSFYKDTKAVVLGSRDLMCIHEEVSRLESATAKIMACHVRVQAHKCGYYNSVSSKKEAIKDQPVVDIEDLVKKGKGHRFCPFFMSREMVQDAEVVFMPYNYLLDPKLRSSHGIELKNCVIILDEGHNIAKICEEAVSFEIKSSTIALCIQELTKALSEYSETNQQLGNNALTKDMSLGNLITLKKAFLDLEEELDKIQATTEGIIIPGQDLLTILFQNGFPPSSLARLSGELDSVSTFLSGNNFESNGCDKFSSILRVLSSQSMFRNPTAFGESYKVFVQQEESKRMKNDIRSYDTKQSRTAKVFNFWCFNPAVGLETMMLNGPRCIILASGTLSPMPFLMKELQIPFQVQLSNPHIIRDNQLYASVVTCGPQNIRLSSSFQTRNDKNYLRSLGEVIRLTCSVVPKGVLVFYPSYAVMDICKKEWESTGVWSSISQVKKVLFEPRGKDAFRQTMEDYYASVKTDNGACLMAVCRGKVSEGLDFTDDNGRAVIITGIPYSPAKDPHVLAKQQYLNSRLTKGDANGINGSTWYQLEATRALNQAIGRIIRHVHDYGAILICDERCASSNFQSNLSQWVRQRLKNSYSFDNTLKELGEFFGSSVQKERKEFAKSLIIKSRASVRVTLPADVVRDRSEQARLSRVLEEKVSKQELDDLYADSECTVVFSSGREANSLPTSLNKKSGTEQNSTTLFGDLMTTSAKTKAANFNSAVPVYPKPFLAYSKSPGGCCTSAGDVQKRKRIKLSSRNTSFSTAAGSSQMLPGTSGFSSFTNLSTLEEFSDVKQFWAWVKSVLSSTSQPQFVKAMKSYKENKSVQILAGKVVSLFSPEDYRKCLSGLSKILSASDIQKLSLLVIKN